MTIYNPDNHNHAEKMDQAMQVMREQGNKALFYTCKINPYGSIDGTAARWCLKGRGFREVSGPRIGWIGQ